MKPKTKKAIKKYFREVLNELWLTKLFDFILGKEPLCSKCHKNPIDKRNESGMCGKCYMIFLIKINDMEENDGR